MADLEDRPVIDETSDSDDGSEENEESDSDFDDDQKPSFLIDEKIVEKNELNRLLESRTPEDVKTLNELVIKIMECDRYKVFEYLLDHGYEIDILNSKGQTAFHVGFYDECQRIKFRHSKKSLLDTFDEYNGSGEILSVMIDEWMLERSFNLSYVDCYGLNYLHIVCFLCDESGPNSLFQKCLNTGIDVNAKFSDPNGLFVNFTPLHFAVINSKCDYSANIIERLLMGNPQVNAKDSFGRTPLHLACEFYKEPHDFFHRNGSTPLSEKSSTLAPLIIGKPLDYYLNNLIVIDQLVQSGANINLKDENGNTPLLSIFPNNYRAFARFDEDWHEYGVPIIETTMKFAYLCKNGAKMTLANKNDDTILHLITKNLKAYRESSEYKHVLFDDHYHLEMIKHIFNSKQNININAKNKKGETPIQWAVESMSIDVVQLLIDHGANCNHLKFDLTNNKFFTYPEVVPNFEATKNLIAITELLLSKDFNLTPDINLKILKFLIHDVSNCQCNYDNYRYLTFLYGSTAHTKQMLKKMHLYIDDGMRAFRWYYYPITVGEIYIDEDIKEIIKKMIDDKNCSINGDDDMSVSKLHDELTLMKSIKLTDNLNVHDLMTKHPYDVPYNVAKNFDYSLLEGMKYYREIVKAHFIKSILRQHVKKMCGNSLKVLCPSLDDLCYEMILDYLSNQDIVNVYSVVISLV